MTNCIRCNWIFRVWLLMRVTLIICPFSSLSLSLFLSSLSCTFDFPIKRSSRLTSTQRFATRTHKLAGYRNLYTRCIQLHTAAFATYVNGKRKRERIKRERRFLYIYYHNVLWISDGREQFSIRFQLRIFSTATISFLTCFRS